MRRPALFLCALALLALWPGNAGAQATSTSVVVLRVEGAIDRPLLSYLQDRLTQAEEDGAIIVLQIDTSGTIDEDGVALAQMVADLEVPTIAWVGPVPAKASGAGLLLMYASSIAAVSPGSQTGPPGTNPQTTLSGLAARWKSKRSRGRLHRIGNMT